MVYISHINTFAVIGAGTMGHEIAQVALMAGFKKVILNDLVKEVIDNAAKKIESNLKKLETKGLLRGGYTPEALMKNLFNISLINISIISLYEEFLSTSLSAWAHCIITMGYERIAIGRTLGFTFGGNNSGWV